MPRSPSLFHYRPRRRRRAPAGRSWWIAAALAPPLALLIYGAIRLALDFASSPRQPASAPAPGVRDAAATPTPEPPLSFDWPTPQTNLHDAASDAVFMPTASGRIESALYGSVRTANAGGALRPSFHEAIDIAPTRRGAGGDPLDPVFAAADGRVAYLNRHAGNSNYGLYAVLLHRDPLGEIYTLYAHLAGFREGLAPGVTLRAGEPIGTMGRTPAGIVPTSRAHLHFEIGLIANARFAAWFRAQKLTPDHGNYNGQNLLGVDPLAVFNRPDPRAPFSMPRYLAELPPAFALVVKAPRRPDYFARYPGLWEGPEATGGTIVMTVSEGGVPLSGRPARPEEAAALAKSRSTASVLDVSEARLGRNGRRIVVREGDRWRVGSNGETWLQILLY
jgi:murein DD-endopeptidase MepM/ murein hydrolase activator NlpD